MSSNREYGETIEWTAHTEPTTPQPTAESTAGPAIKSPSIQTVCETVLGLRSQELAVYDAISTDPGAATKTLAETLGRDRSNVNRSLTKLESAGLVTRHRRILDSGGYYYANYAAPGDVVEEVVSAALDRWLSDARSTVEDREWENSIGDTDS